MSPVEPHPHSQRPVRQEPRMSRARLALATALALVLLGGSGCSLVDGAVSSSDAPTASATPKPSASPTPYASQFTRDGTYQSHIRRDRMDFVYTLYPTKSTPRTNEWYPRGRKYFSFTFQAYDLSRRIRAPFSTKREVYLDHISVSSQVRTKDGTNDEHPYALTAVARRVTFDPEPQATDRGMLITSPKGAFELRNQAIRPTALDSIGIDLTFTAVVWVERSAGSGSFVRRVVRQKVPISIFSSTKPTQAQSIPVDAN